MIRKIALLSLSFGMCFSLPVFAQIRLAGNTDYTLTMSPSVRTEIISLNNSTDLDSSNSDDRTTYFGLEYSLAFDLKSKDLGPQLYVRFNRSGPYGYGAPVFVHNTLQTSSGPVEKYQNADLLPELKEFWLDSRVWALPVRWKTGAFAFDIGHGLISSYENYGIEFYNDQEDSLAWHLRYFYPDLTRKQSLGPIIGQEKDQLIDYEHSKAHLMVADVVWPVHEQAALQPYVSILYDTTDGKRSSYFTTPTHKDTLGVAGISYDAVFGKLTIELDAAKNFGKAKSSDDGYEDVTHQGYALYEGMAYEIGRFKPRSRMIYASGNKVSTEMVDNGDTTLGGGKNRAFSSYSPFNTNLADSLTQSVVAVPLVAMGEGWGLNYGISRPTTFADGTLLDNIFLWSVGFEYRLTDKLTSSVDGWFLRSAQKGIGTLNGSAVELSQNLGKEIDLTLAYALNENVTLNWAGGCFWPGRYYKEERDDSDGSLLTPFLRGDGEADKAYQVEIYMTAAF